jgi:hypothetical protein
VGLDEDAADDGPSSVAAEVAAAVQRPGQLGPGEGRRDEGQGAGDEECRSRPLEEPEQDERVERRRQTAQDAGDPEPDEADAEDALPTVPVVERPAEDEQRRQHGEVAGVDVGLALEDAEVVGRQLLADLRQGDVDHGPVEKDDRRAKVAATIVQRWRAPSGKSGARPAVGQADPDRHQAVPEGPPAGRRRGLAGPTAGPG